MIVLLEPLSINNFSIFEISLYRHLYGQLDYIIKQ